MNELTKSVIPRWARHQVKRILMRGRDQVEDPLMVVRNTPAGIPGSMSLFDRRIEFLDAPTFLSEYDQIFLKQTYRFATDDPKPIIIDAEAGIGLAVIYFIRLYPGAHIVAFEPDPDTFLVLQKNCKTFELNNIELHQEAASVKNGTVRFKRESPHRDFRAVHHASDEDVSVSQRRLRDFLKERVTLLKMNIQGAETEVLEDSGDSLKNVEYLFVEYNSFWGRDQSLHRLLHVIANAGFRINIHAIDPPPQPLFLREIRAKDLLDMKLNIFCYRV